MMCFIGENEQNMLSLSEQNFTSCTVEHSVTNREVSRENRIFVHHHLSLHFVCSYIVNASGF